MYNVHFMIPIVILINGRLYDLKRIISNLNLFFPVIYNISEDNLYQ